MSAWNNAEGGIVDSFDPGTPEARRAWLDSLPVGAVVCFAGWTSAVKRVDGWWLAVGPPQRCDAMEYASASAEWPVFVIMPDDSHPFACPADWTPPQPDEVRAMLAKVGLSQVEAARSLGMSRSAVAKWLSGESRTNWPTWRVLVALADERG